jgi:hypothetical protein
MSRLSTRTLVLFFLALSAAGGCTLIAEVDRTKIDEGGGGADGDSDDDLGGAGGAN